MIPLLVFFLGLFWGSFLDAIIDRMSEGKSALKGRSYCPYCKHQLAWFDLIPLLSFILLLGKCRYCKKPISLQYPLVELAVGFLFLALFSFAFSPWSGQGVNNLVGPSFSSIMYFAYLLIISSFLVIIFVYDLKYFLIPDIVVYSAIGITFLYRIFEVLPLRVLLRGILQNEKNLGSLEKTLLSAFFAALFFFAIYFVSKGKWMGFGDVNLAFFMGLFLGFPSIVVALFFAFFTGAFVGIALILLKKKRMGSEVPFGPFLIVSTFFALFWGQTLFNWYLKFLLV